MPENGLAVVGVPCAFSKTELVVRACVRRLAAVDIVQADHRPDAVLVDAVDDATCGQGAEGGLHCFAAPAHLLQVRRLAAVDIVQADHRLDAVLVDAVDDATCGQGAEGGLHCFAAPAHLLQQALHRHEAVVLAAEGI